MTPTPAATAATPRLAWMDCVKVLGMYLIIVGHMDVPGREFVYGVSVPVFFWASGYLDKETSWPTLLRKCLLNLFLPALTLVLLYKTVSFFLHGYNGSVLVFLAKNVVCSFLGIHGWFGIGMAWFVYTLVCLKLLRKACGLKWLTWGLIPAAALAIIFSAHSLFFANAIANVTVALPFFVAGIWCRQLKFAELIASWSAPIFFVILALYAVGVCLNGTPWMFMNGYGHSYVLFTLTGLTGISGLIWLGIKVAPRLSSRPMAIITLLAEGALLVLCTQQTFFGPFQHQLMAWIYGLAVYLSYIPLIWICRKWMPFLLGAYGRNSLRLPAIGNLKDTIS